MAALTRPPAIRYDKRMNPPDSPSNDPLRLNRMLKSAGYRSCRIDAKSRMVNFICRTREWALAIRLTPDWLNITTLVCELPKEPGVRARLLEFVLQTNRNVPLVKFGIAGECVNLELDYRAEHIDEAVLSNLIGLVQSVAEEQYPRIFRIVNGDDVLESLGRTLEAGSAS
jgi:hypothetical protein